MKSLKKMMIATLAMVLSVAMLSGCGSDTANEGGEPTAAPANRLEEILQRGVLIMATSPDYAPAEFINPNATGDDQYVGADIELGKYIAEQLGVEFELKTMEFAMVLSSVQLGDADIAISGFGWKPDREESFELSIGYNQDGESSCQGLMVKTDKLDEYKTLADFSGKSIVAQPGSLQEGYVNEQIENPKLTLVADLGLAVEMLKNDNVEAFACSCAQMEAYANANPEIAKSTVEFDTSEADLHDGNVVAVKKGETEFIEKVNEILTEVNESGKYEVWYEEAKELAATLGLEFED